MSLEDGHLESLQLKPFSHSHYEHVHFLQLQTTIDSVNSARHKKGLPNINFSIPNVTRLNMSDIRCAIVGHFNIDTSIHTTT